MLPLPPIAPMVGWRRSLRLPRDHYIRLDANDYSVHPAAIGRRIELVAGLDRVQAFCDGRIVADHPRCWATHQSIIDPDHADAAQALRRSRLSIVPDPTSVEVEQRRLRDYDTLFGLDDEASG
ncbi:hypothetical protein K3M35_25505 [Rhodococcus sp. DMU2021]|nr:hypothetical protein [Rhodococcus sp. DMU2021]